MATEPIQQFLETVHSAAQTYADQIATTAGAAAHAASGGEIDPFVFRLAIFALAVFVGYYVVWSVTPRYTRR